MDITHVTLNPIAGEGKSKAIGDVVLDDSLVIKSMRVVEGPKGLFVSFPQKKVQKDGEDKADYSDLVFAKDKDLRSKIHKAVLDKFEEVKAA